MNRISQITTVLPLPGLRLFRRAAVGLLGVGIFSLISASTARGGNEPQAESSPSPVVSYGTAKLNGLDVFYREAGPKDAPVLLLLHGFPSSSRMYQPLLESRLSARYHLIAPDYPG